MSEATDKAVTVLTGLVEKAASGIDSAVAFSQAQIPDVIQQLLLWKLTISLVHFILGVLTPFLCIFACRKIISSFNLIRDRAIAAREKDELWTRYHATSNMTSSSFDVSVSPFTKYLFVFIVCAVGATLTIALLNLTWLKIWLAPKLYLLEYAASLVK